MSTTTTTTQLLEITREQAAQLYELGVELRWMPYGIGSLETDVFIWSIGHSPLHPGLAFCYAQDLFMYKRSNSY